MDRQTALSLIAQIVEKRLAERQSQLGIGVMSGLTGLALFFIYTGQALGEQRYMDTGHALLEQVIDQLNEGTYLPVRRMHSFSNGITGIAFAFLHMQRQQLIDVDIEETFAVFDEQLVKAALQDYQDGISDFLHGPMGVFYYFSKRYPHHKSVAVHMDQLLQGFIRCARIDQQGLRIRNMILQETGDLDYDLGLAHGMTGNIFILAESMNAGYHTQEIKALIENGLKYICSRERVIDRCWGNSCFPSSVNEQYPFGAPENLSGYNSRLAWCYGDLNIAMLFIRMGRLLNKQELYEKGVAVGRLTANRLTYDENHVGDIYFCHGAAGVRYSYDKLYQLTGDQCFLEARTFWEQQLFERLQPERIDVDSNMKLFTLLEGLPGIGLSLLPAGIQWDQFFLLQ